MFILLLRVDYLVSVDTEEKAKVTLKDSKLLSLFKSIEKMGEEDKTVIEKLISAFIIQKETKQKLAQ